MQDVKESSKLKNAIMVSDIQRGEGGGRAHMWHAGYLPDWDQSETFRALDSKREGDYG